MGPDNRDELFDDSQFDQAAPGAENPFYESLDETHAVSEPEADLVKGGMEHLGGEVPSAEEEVTSEPAPAEEAAEEEKPRRPGFFARLTQTSPYVVMLLLSLVALIVGTVMLGVELWRYQFEIKPPG